MFKAVYQLKELGTFKTLAEAFKVIYDKIKAEKVLLWQMLETTIWIEAPCDVISFYDARDEMCKQGYLVNGKWVDKDIPPDPQYGREPDKVKPKTGIIYGNCDGCKNEVCPHRVNKPKSLAQYLGEYLATGIDRTHEAGMPMDFTEEGLKEVLEQALDAYESTEQVKIKIERI